MGNWKIENKPGRPSCLSLQGIDITTTTTTTIIIIIIIITIMTIVLRPEDLTMLLLRKRVTR